MPDSFDTLLWVIYPDGDTSEDKLIDKFIHITGLPLPQKQYTELLTQDMQDEPKEETHCYWDLQTHEANIERLLEEIIKADIGGLRDLTASVFLLNTELNVLFYLYDDRGLDIAAESCGTIVQMYRKFNGWILEYDRAKTERTFNQEEET